LVEHEVKLRFESVAAAREAVVAAGGRGDVARRLLDDELFDTADQRLRGEGRALRLRIDGERALLTVKGPPMPGPVKSREELETFVGDGATARAMLDALGFRPCFRSQKYREEFLVAGARVTVDETPIGVFVEIEAAPDRIPDVARRLGRSPDDFILASYPGLYREWCASRGIPPGSMVFPPEGPYT
jgi:adenylate cyclase class 2